jgi:hypothetical protein
MKVISGGQTGVDQAALRAAQVAGLEIGGWCPPGRMCESGRIPQDFPLVETPEERSSKASDIARSLRTEWNVRDSDGTLIVRRLVPVPQLRPDPGTSWTFECAVLYGKPLLLCDPEDPEGANARMVRDWLAGLRIDMLNVARPSESAQPGIGKLAGKFLLSVFKGG